MNDRPDPRRPAALAPDLGHLAIHHIGIAVASIEGSRPLYTTLSGAPGGPIIEVPDQRVNVAFFGQVELLEPRGDDSPVGRFLASRGPGLHHLAFQVSDIRSELARLKAAGFRLLDQEPRMGATGHPIAFIHPEGTGGVLVELVELPS
ncbi:MAG: methylmalonyl-CoA epimerase [Gemmatimonadota bacterium]